MPSVREAIDTLCGRVPLAHDLREAFPEMKGISPLNFKYMRASAEAWRMSNLCNRLLHNSRGSTTSYCSTG